LAVVFFSVATWDLGMTQTPVTTVQFSAGQSFYVNLGASTTVKSIVFLLKDGGYNLTVTAGSPDNWTGTSASGSFSDYYKWNEVQFFPSTTTQYLKVDFRARSDSQNAIIAEIAVINSSGQRLPVASVNNLTSDNSNLSNLIDEQDLIQYPATYMSQTYFDEIYFVRTAEQYLNRQFPYEWTHPPMGKLIQAAGIVGFGYSPFGWRLMGVIFATLMIPVMYLLGKRLFGTWIGAFTSAFLLTFDFMHFTMGRMGTADTYVVFFSLLSQLCFLIYFLNVIKNGWKTSVLPLFMAVIFFALGFSTKWLVLYGALGMLALLAALRIREIKNLKKGLGDKYAAFFDHPFLLLLGFIGVAVVIYFLTYLPDMWVGRPFIGGNGVIQLQFDMYNYHATLTASHQFASPWWSWPLMLNPTPGSYVPLWLAISYLPNSVDSTISVFGNPAVWWVGFVCMLIVAERAILGKELVSSIRKRFAKKKLNSEVPSSISPETPVASSTEEVVEAKPLPQPAESLKRRYDVAAVFIAVVFFFSWIPYVFISRVTFIYHFYVAMPYLALASAYLVNQYWNTKKGKIAAIVFFASVVVMFAVFYPVISGAPTSISWIRYLKWLPGWFFAP
jgi:dolichyl-phosphate-mannose--protein O-mannosyl transferase